MTRFIVGDDRSQKVVTDWLDTACDSPFTRSRIHSMV
jgi:hypothetical protein